MAMNIDVHAGELNLVAASMESSEWEGVLRKLKSEASTLHIRCLQLDDNDFSVLPVAVLAEAVARFDRLTDLSMCDANLSGSGAQQLLKALGAVPAFSKTHAEVWAPIEEVVSLGEGQQRKTAAEVLKEDKKIVMLPAQGARASRRAL